MALEQLNPFPLLYPFTFFFGPNPFGLSRQTGRVSACNRKPMEANQGMMLNDYHSLPMNISVGGTCVSVRRGFKAGLACIMEAIQLHLSGGSGICCLALAYYYNCYKKCEAGSSIQAHDRQRRFAANLKPVSLLSLLEQGLRHFYPDSCGLSLARSVMMSCSKESAPY